MIANILSGLILESRIDEVVLFSILMIITVLFEWHYIVGIVDEMCTILEIKVFRVKKIKTLLTTPLIEKEQNISSDVNISPSSDNL